MFNHTDNSNIGAGDIAPWRVDRSVNPPIQSLAGERQSCRFRLVVVRGPEAVELGGAADVPASGPQDKGPPLVLTDKLVGIRCGFF
jgi:hypothetical protein